MKQELKKELLSQLKGLLNDVREALVEVREIKSELGMSAN